MPDMLVKLYDLPAVEPYRHAMAEGGVTLRHVLPHERAPVARWIHRHFGDGWAGEFEASFADRPATTLLATHAGVVRGFACYEVTARGFFGPTGVDPAWRGRGIGAALLVESLHRMQGLGYAYAVIGGAGPQAFYRRHVSATAIPDSEPGVYADPLQPDASEAS